MSMRKLNFSGRKKIAWSDISFEITKADIYTITKVEIDNAKYGFPASSKVQLVVKQGQREPSFKLGTVSSPKGLPLPLYKDFLVEDRLRFTLKVADEDGHWLGWSANWHYPAKEAKSSTSEHSFFVFKPDETVRNYQVNCPDEQTSFDGSNPVEVLMNQDLHGRFLKEPEINVLVQRVFWNQFSGRQNHPKHRKRLTSQHGRRLSLHGFVEMKGSTFSTATLTFNSVWIRRFTRCTEVM